MRNPAKSRHRFGRKAIAAVLRHHRHKPMQHYLEYLKSDSQPRRVESCVKMDKCRSAEEARENYRPPLKQWWLDKLRVKNEPGKA